MNAFSNASRTAAALALSALGLVLASSAPALAGKSHMNQKPEALVQLTSFYAGGTGQCESGWTDYDLRRVGADGVAEASAFVVPEGYRLVVTDMDWTVQAASTFAATDLLTFQVRSSNAFSPYVYTTATAAGATVDAIDLWYGEAHLESGISIGAGLTVCPDSKRFFAGGSSTSDVIRFNVQGYLIKSK